jgi:glycosyltransferase involved in cell wall biosynthesis
MKHIVEIIPALGYGGAERLVVDLVNHSDNEKYRFSIIVFFDDIPLGSLLKKRADIILVEKKSKFDLGFLSRLEKKLAELKPDLIHGHLFAGDFWGRLAAHRLGIPFLSTEHNLNYGDGYLKNFVKKMVISDHDHSVACSLAVSGYMRAVYKIKREITVINNGLELERFTVLPSAIFGDSLHFLMVGRLVKQKGHIIALSALNNLKNYSWRLTIVGSGEEKTPLQKFIDKNGLSSRVQIITPTTEIDKYYREADILLMPSNWEGLGVAAMEAMASSRLVVASNTGGLAELIVDNKTGYLVNPADVLAWQKKLKYIFENKLNCLELAKNGQKYAKNNFGIDKMIKKYDQIFSLVANK